MEDAPIRPPLIRIREAAQHDGRSVRVQGWVHNRTDKGRLQFLMLRDGLTFRAVLELPMPMLRRLVLRRNEFMPSAKPGATVGPWARSVATRSPPSGMRSTLSSRCAARSSQATAA